MMRPLGRYFSFLPVLMILWTCNAVSQVAHLQLKFKANDVIRFMETTQNDMTSEESPGAGQKIFNEMFSTQKVKLVNPDGSARIIRTIDSINTQMNGQPFDSPQGRLLVAIPIQVTVAPTGKILDAQPENDSVAAPVKQAVDAFRTQIMTQPGYPKTAIALNQSWNDSASYSQDSPAGKMNVNFWFSTRYVGVDTISGIEVRVLERSLELSGTIGNGTGTIKGNGKSTVYFSETLGKEILSSTTVDQAVDMVTPQGSMRMKIKVASKKELLK